MAVRVRVGYGGCLVGIVLASRSRFLLYTKHAAVKKKYLEKKKRKKLFKRILWGRGIYIPSHNEGPS